MNQSVIELDMMELADIGQPTKIADEIHRQLRVKNNSVPLPIPLKRLAEAAGIKDIQEKDDLNFEGIIVIRDGSGVIGLKKNSYDPRKNFTLAHELGHYFIPTHRVFRKNFECGKDKIKYVSSQNSVSLSAEDKIEQEANEFAAALLVPMPEYRNERKKLGAGTDVNYLISLADKFDVSKAMMAHIFVRNESENVAIIISKDCVVQTVIPKAGFPHMGLKKNMPLVGACITKDILKKYESGHVTELKEVSVDAWIPGKNSISEMYEQIYVQDDGWMITLLVADEEEVDEDDDDNNWNRRNLR